MEKAEGEGQRKGLSRRLCNLQSRIRGRGRVLKGEMLFWCREGLSWCRRSMVAAVAGTRCARLCVEERLVVASGWVVP